MTIWLSSLLIANYQQKVPFVLRERLVRFEQASRNKIEFRDPLEEFQEVLDLNLDNTQITCIEGINPDSDNETSHEILMSNQGHQRFRVKRKIK